MLQVRNTAGEACRRGFIATECVASSGEIAELQSTEHFFQRQPSSSINVKGLFEAIGLSVLLC